jgi:hypothetical protein
MRLSWNWINFNCFSSETHMQCVHLVLNLGASTSILQSEAIWATLRLSREIWRINKSFEVLTKARGNIQPL